MSVASSDGKCSGAITGIAAKPEKILPDLLPFYLRTDAFFDFAVRGSGGSLSPRVKWSHISAYEFDLPPMEEQKKLAELLWAANDLKSFPVSSYLGTKYGIFVSATTSTICKLAASYCAKR